MTLEEFRNDFLSEVALWAETESTFTQVAFAAVAVRYLSEAGEVSDFTETFYRGTFKSKRLGVDGYAFDEADGSLRIFFVGAIGVDLSTLTQTDARVQFQSLTNFVDYALLGQLGSKIDDNSPGRDLAELIFARRQTLSRVRAYLITDSILSARIKDWPEGRVGDVPIEYHIWDISRFFRAFSSQTGEDELVVSFANVRDGGLACLAAGMEPGKYVAYLCVVPAHILADIYDEHGSRLLEGNVRAFLSTKGNTNKGIRNTVLNAPEMFFAYNNGIAATATSATVLETATGLRLVEVVDLQIVNGGQTTASLASARRVDKANLHDIYVPMKLSVIDAETSVEMIPLISKYSNSQNKVSEADFFSNHAFHRRLEQSSRRLWAPAQAGLQYETKWFYERARGQYVNDQIQLTVAEKRRFELAHPRLQVITKTDLAKTENSWRRLPQKVSKGAQTNFLDFASYIVQEWDKDQVAFNEQYFREIVCRTILFRTTEKLVSKADWYDGGYRSNIVAYAVARLSHELELITLALNYELIWRAQIVSPALEEQLTLIAEKMRDVIINPPVGHQNVTQWAKRDLCWENAKAVTIHLSSAFEAELISRNSARLALNEARTLQKLDSGIEAQTKVMTIGFELWGHALSWAKRQNLIGIEDERILKVAANQLPGIPTDRQSKKLLEILQKLEAEGFNSTKSH